ncbi:hypothetical protein D9756_000958 [Leucocoprinus leucothites]|uniref:Uncharacterized protein n=1 Tax=Leucocoprinus leucothites TaxID=201217 RepID=A0A8H5GEX9_9AGAR|nr:hypothetical protein D9756_000958 [Leucoagaricus leucothites]
MARQAPRLHRLPQRLDYTLVPAPLDLSLPSITEKSPLPAIIVTPSSPVHTHDFSIAFLAAPPKPTFRERVLKSVNTIADNSWLAQSRSLRTFLILALLFFIMITTHLIAHRVSVYPYYRFDSDTTHLHLSNGPISNALAVEYQPAPPDGDARVGIWHWIGFEFRKAWSVTGGVAVEDSFTIGDTILERADSLSALE